MTTEDALLAAVAANPADDLPRLVYADWCDENGRPVRAEFIRLQIEIAKKETLPRAALNVFSYLWKRQQELLDDHADELLGPLPNSLGPHDYEFRRGFLIRIESDAPGFLNLQAHLGFLVPLPAVRVTDDARRIADLSESPHLWLLTEFCLYRHSRESQQEMTTDEIVQGLVRVCKQATRLAVLELARCNLSDGLVELFRLPAFPALTDLDLTFNDLTDAGVIELLNTGLPQRLKRLFLGGNPIGDQGAMELADRLGPVPTFEHLNLRYGTNLGRAGHAAILAAFGGRVDLF